MSTPDDSTRICALLLAAGAGRRFDPSGDNNKLLARIGGESIAVLSARNLIAAALPVTAVVQPGAEELHRALSDAGCRISICDKAELGMGHSLAHGVGAIVQNNRADAILVALADMPFLEPATISRVARSVNEKNTIAAAAIDGRRGHPVAFWHTHFAELMSLDGDRGAADLLRTHPVQLVATDDAAIARDIDKPDDLTN